MLSMAEYKPVIVVTGAYFAVFYSFMIFQSTSKMYLYSKAKASKKSDEKVSMADIKYGSTRGLGLLGDRTFLNMLEQSPAFLTSLWLHALFVDPETAAKAGWLYVLFRLWYPFGFSMGLPWILLSTLPNYGIIFYLLGSTIMKALA